jgi:Ras-related C3 botulinum toxin substrate 1
MAERTCKVVVVGDGTVGKTSLLNVYVGKEFPTGHTPTVFENYSGSVTVNGEVFNLVVWDTAGQEEFESIRTASYNDTDIFLVCFGVNSSTSLHNVEDCWARELDKLKKGKSASHRPVRILVGTKADLREGTAPCVSHDDAILVQNSIKAAQYIECSALRNVGVQDVFTTALQRWHTAQTSGGGDGKKKKKSSCSMM